MMREDTIAAPATPPGRGGIGTVRLSGPRAGEIARNVLQLPPQPLEARRATLVKFPDPEDGRILDEVVVTYFPGPRSYTGEDVVEISCHGSPVILSYLMQCCQALGARVAEPGEFTLRAFLNGRMDLSQAEAVRDLIESRTLYQARVAALQLEGSLSARVKPNQESLVNLIATLEAGIDFGEDDIPAMPWEEIGQRVETLRQDIGALAETYRYGRIVREGLTLALAGRPNVGKSSVFNRLLNMERAIVTPIPGTTRDLISETATLDDIPIRFVDTAGIRPAQDEVEQMGIEKSRQAIADADVRLLVLDVSEAWHAEDSELILQMCRLGPSVIVANKRDLPIRLARSAIEKAVLSCQASSSPAPSIIYTSAKTGEGFEELRDHIISAVTGKQGQTAEGEWLTNARHYEVIHQSLQALERAQQAAAQRVHHEMILLDLYDALGRLGELTGATDVENILGVIFSKFCIGK